MKFTSDMLKGLAGMVLFLTWVLLVVLQIPNTTELISAIKMVLVGLASHYLTYADPTASNSTTITLPKS